jgi:hypothetical protein
VYAIPSHYAPLMPVANYLQILNPYYIIFIIILKIVLSAYQNIYRVGHRIRAREKSRLLIK